MKTSRNKSNLKLQSACVLSQARRLTGNAKKKKKAFGCFKIVKLLDPHGPQEQPPQIMHSCVFKEPADWHCKRRRQADTKAGAAFKCCRKNRNCIPTTGWLVSRACADKRRRSGIGHQRSLVSVCWQKSQTVCQISD